MSNSSKKLHNLTDYDLHKELLRVQAELVALMSAVNARNPNWLPNDSDAEQSLFYAAHVTIDSPQDDRELCVLCGHDHSYNLGTHRYVRLTNDYKTMPGYYRPTSLSIEEKYKIGQNTEAIICTDRRACLNRQQKGCAYDRLCWYICAPDNTTAYQAIAGRGKRGMG
ncbi:MAG: hypothetical protein AAF126_00365 [Chloroflexota bacterium]